MLVGHVERSADHGRELVGPRLELGEVRRRHAEEGTDHGHGERIGQIRDHLHLAAPGHSGDEAVDELLDRRAEALDPAGDEGPAHGGAQARMVGRIAKDGPEAEGARQIADVCHSCRRHVIDEGGDAVRREPRVIEGRAHVGIARQHPAAQALAPMDRVLLAQAAEERIGIGAHLGAAEIQVDGHRVRPASPRYAAALTIWSGDPI